MTTLEHPVTPNPVLDAVLRSRALDVVGRVLLTFPFWGSGFAKLIDFQAGAAEMAHFGLQPAAAYNALTTFVQLGGSALIISRRWMWLGAGALGVFTAPTIPIVHHFWISSGEQATIAFRTATEHVGIIGALVLVSILAVRA